MSRKVRTGFLKGHAQNQRVWDDGQHTSRFPAAGRARRGIARPATCRRWDSSARRRSLSPWPSKRAPPWNKGRILGAGVAGLSAAYELGRAGYDCTVLEARDRVGGRSWTIRRGTRLELTDGSHQICEFDQDLYWNAGAARLPSHHQAVLGYCRELGVALEVEVNTNRGAKLLNQAANSGKPIELRQVANDVRGEISELLGKAINRGALDQELTAYDKERMLAFLRQYGDLSPDLLYKGSTRAGYKTLPGPADQVGVKRDPVPLGVLLDADMWAGLLLEESFTQQATMFQPVGGMDRIAAAFAEKVGPIVRLANEVTAIRRGPGG